MHAMAGGPMMWLMGLLCLLLFVVLALAAISLVKYLFFSGRYTSKDRF